MRNIILILCLVYTLSGCNNTNRWVESEQVEQIKIGMSASKAFEILEINSEKWDEWDGRTYKYGRNFTAPTGYINTFWVYVRDGKVSNAYCI